MKWVLQFAQACYTIWTVYKDDRIEHYASQVKDPQLKESLRWARAKLCNLPEPPSPPAILLSGLLAASENPSSGDLHDQALFYVE